MKILTASGPDLEKAAKALLEGYLVAFPTETVYGLGADAFNARAVAKVFEAKNRPFFDPLIIHIAEMETLPRIVDCNALSAISREKLSILTERLWPGPLTLILPKQKEVPDLTTAGLTTAAVRFPAHPAAQQLIRLSSGAVAAPSANPFGRISPTRAEHVKTGLGDKVDFIIDGGKTQVGLESTVLDLNQEKPLILRPGGVSLETLQALIGAVEFSLDSSPEKPVSPGQLKNHYSPRTPLILCRQGEMDAGAPGEGRLYFSLPKNINRETAFGSIRVLSESSDLAEAAVNLFDMLHELDALGLKLIRAEEAPETGLGLAINDRLRRASGSQQ